MMAKHLFREALFVKSATSSLHYPKLLDASGNPLPEFAVAGRSNVGKSSLLNHLFQCKNLAKTSATPGKTQLINFFNLHQQISFVDLPGYGYAQVPAGVKNLWGEMVESYFRERASLKLILLLLDIRRDPNEDDLRLLDWVVHHQKALLLVLTKVDKVKQNELAKRTEQILDVLPYNNIHHLHYSTLKNIGRDQLIFHVQDALADETSD